MGEVSQQSPLTEQAPPTGPAPQANRAVKPRRRRSLLAKGYIFTRRRIFDAYVLRSFKAEAIITILALIGILGLAADRVFTQRQQMADARVKHQFARHEKREEAMTRFLDGIPKNISHLSNLQYMALWLDRHVNETGKATYFDGRKYGEVSQAYFSGLQEWRATCPHYGALCEEIIGRFCNESEIDIRGKTDADKARRDCLRTAVRGIGDLLDSVNAVSLRDRDIKDAHEQVAASVAAVSAAIARWAVHSDGKHRISRPTTQPSDMIEAIQVGDVWPAPPIPEDQSSSATQPIDRRFKEASGAVDEIVSTLDNFQILALRLMHKELATMP